MSYTSSAASSRRQSMMLPPAIPITGGVLGPPGFSGAGSLGSLGSDIGVGPGPGPQRHPKPLTAADLHSQLEREQEAVVNRLTRELAALRAQQSHGSSAVEEPTPLAGSPIVHHNYSPHIPRHHRTGSNTSTSGAGVLAGPNPLSRQNSTRSIRSVNTGGRTSPAVADRLPLPLSSTSGASLVPSLGGGSGTYPYAGYYGYQYQGGLGIANVSANGSETNLLGASEGRGGSSLAETLAWKAELENVKRENEALRKRVKELERVLKQNAGVEPEGWSGGSVTGAHHGRRSRSSSMSIRERGRRDRRHGEEAVKEKKDETVAEEARKEEGAEKKDAAKLDPAPVLAEEKAATL